MEPLAVPPSLGARTEPYIGVRAGGSKSEGKGHGASVGQSEGDRGERKDPKHIPEFPSTTWRKGCTDCVSSIAERTANF